MPAFRGKNLIVVARDVADGYVAVNPLLLKPLDAEALKGFHHQIMKVQTEIRAGTFPFNDITAIRHRNMKLQRLHNATVVIKNFAKERKMRGLFQ